MGALIEAAASDHIISDLILVAFLSLLVGYLLGSVNFSIIITKLFQKKDIRNFGSGNAGATNVMRSVGRLPAVLTFIFDFLKCILSIVVGYYLFVFVCGLTGVPETTIQIGKYVSGIGCILGHIFPLYFHFRGGKGVTTTAALICLIDWRVFIPAFLTFLIIVLIKKIVSLGSVIGVSCYPVYTFIIMFLFDYVNGPLVPDGTASMGYILLSTAAAAVIGGIVVLQHRTNIKRLMKGEEKPLTFRGKKSL